MTNLRTDLRPRHSWKRTEHLLYQVILVFTKSKATATRPLVAPVVAVVVVMVVRRQDMQSVGNYIERTWSLGLPPPADSLPKVVNCPPC